MSLYLAEKIQNPTGAPAIFLAKKLNGYIPSSIHNLSITGVSKYPELAYGVYRNNIDAFCYASYKKVKIFAQAEGFSDISYETPFIPISTHSIVFSPAAKLTNDQATILLKKLGDGATMKFVGKTLEYTIPNPSMAQLPKFIQASNPNYAVGPNRLTPLGFKAYMKVMTCVDLFLSANVM